MILENDVIYYQVPLLCCTGNKIVSTMSYVSCFPVLWESVYDTVDYTYVTIHNILTLRKE